MEPKFNIFVLMAATVVLCVVGLVSAVDNDFAAVANIFAGFLYVSVLYVSLVKKVDFKKFAIVCLGLGFIRFFLIYTSAIFLWLPQFVLKHIFLLVPSVSGAAITLFFMYKFWGLIFNKVEILLILLFIGIFSLIYPSLVELTEANNQYKGLFLIGPCVYWWFFFSLALSIYQVVANKSTTLRAVV